MIEHKRILSVLKAQKPQIQSHIAQYDNYFRYDIPATCIPSPKHHLVKTLNDAHT